MLIERDAPYLEFLIRDQGARIIRDNWFYCLLHHGWLMTRADFLTLHNVHAMGSLFRYMDVQAL